MNHCTLILAGLVVATTIQANAQATFDRSAQQKRFSAVEFTTHQIIQQLQFTKPGTVESAIGELSMAASYLFQKIHDDEILTQRPSMLLIESLEESAAVLRELTSDTIPVMQTIDIINAIKDDYSVIASSAALSSSSNIITQVTVTVVTQSGSQQRPGYDVMYTHMWDALAKKKKRSFNNQTNNALHIMAPGYYVFWIEKNGVVVQTKNNVEIGNLGLTADKLIFNL